MCKEKKRKKKKKVKEKERKEKVSPRKTNCLCFIRSICSFQALVYCKCGHWLLRCDLRRSCLLLFSLRVYSLLLLKKITPNCFLSSNVKQKRVNTFTHLTYQIYVDTSKVACEVLSFYLFKSTLTSFIDSKNILMSLRTQGEHVERSLNAPVALSLNE